MWTLYRLSKMNVFEIIYRLKQEFKNKKLRKKCLYSVDYININWLDNNIKLKITTDKKVLKRDEIFLHNKCYKVDLNNKFLMDPDKKIIWEKNFFKDISFRNSSNLLDPKVIWEINKQQYLISWALKYNETQNSKYANYIIDDINDWINQNEEYRTINWCSGLEISIRCINWIIAIDLIKDFIEDNKIFMNNITNSIYKQTMFVYDRLSLFSSANNHLIGELTFVLLSCTFLEFKNNYKIFNKCLELMNKQIFNQFHVDGINKEQSINYQLHTMEFYLICKYFLNLKNIDFNNETISILKKAANYINTISTCDGKTFNIGDEDGGKIITCDYNENQILYILNLSKKILGYDNAVINKKEYTDIRLNLLDNIRNKTNKNSKEILCNFYKNGGMYIKNTDEFILSFDCGESGLSPLYAHAHNDALSINLIVRNEFFLVDNGTYKYHHTKGLRDFFRGVSAHNTISINQENHFKLLGPFICSRSPKVLLENKNEIIVGKINLNKNIVIKRELKFLEKDILLIIDTVIKKNKNDELVEVYFNLHPKCIYESINNEFIIKNGSAMISLYLDKKLMSQVRRVPYSEKYNELSETNQILGSIKINKTEVFYHKIKI